MKKPLLPLIFTLATCILPAQVKASIVSVDFTDFSFGRFNDGYSPITSVPFTLTPQNSGFGSYTDNQTAQIGFNGFFYNEISAGSLGYYEFASGRSQEWGSNGPVVNGWVNRDALIGSLLTYGAIIDSTSSYSGGIDVTSATASHNYLSMKNNGYFGYADISISDNNITINSIVFNSTKGQGLYAGTTTSVPEPSTYALFGIGAIGLQVVLRRRKTT
jgi:hypothetical protein